MTFSLNEALHFSEREYLLGGLTLVGDIFNSLQLSIYYCNCLFLAKHLLLQRLTHPPTAHVYKVIPIRLITFSLVTLK